MLRLRNNEGMAYYTAYQAQQFATSQSEQCGIQYVDCNFCKGEGSISSDVLKETTRCTSCKGGKVLLAYQIYNRLLWCSCKEKQYIPAIYARDGVLVFGTITQLCSCCGRVRCFL